MVSVYSLETCDRVKRFNALWLRRGEGREEKGREGGRTRKGMWPRHVPSGPLPFEGVRSSRIELAQGSRPPFQGRFNLSPNEVFPTLESFVLELHVQAAG